MTELPVDKTNCDQQHGNKLQEVSFRNPKYCEAKSLVLDLLRATELFPLLTTNFGLPLAQTLNSHQQQQTQQSVNKFLMRSVTYFNS